MAYISLDDDLPCETTASCRSPARERKWSARRTLAFVVASSLALWMLILSPFLFF